MTSNITNTITLCWRLEDAIERLDVEEAVTIAAQLLETDAGAEAYVADRPNRLAPYGHYKSADYAALRGRDRLEVMADGIASRILGPHGLCNRCFTKRRDDGTCRICD